LKRLREKISVTDLLRLSIEVLKMLTNKVGCFIKLFSIPLLADWEILLTILQSLRHAQLLALKIIFLASPEAECAAGLIKERTSGGEWRREFLHIGSLPPIH
jgi:hypothetical protein